MMKVDWIQLPYSNYDFRDETYCTSCPMNMRTKITFVPFEVIGNNPNPRVMFVAQSPYKEEFKLARPLVGKAGELLRNLVGDYLDEYALGNVVCCHPTVAKKPIQPDTETLEYCHTHIHQFVEQVQPKVIILLGAEAMKSYYPLPLREKLGKTFDGVGKMSELAPQEYEGILYAVMHHPSFINYNGGTKYKEYPRWRKRLEDILELIPALEIEEKFNCITTTHGMDRLLDVLAAFESYMDVGLDYEALDLDPWRVTNKPTGFSLSYIIDKRRGRAYFIEIDRQPTEQEKRALLAFFKKKRVWTYNAKYEMNVTWSWLGERIHFQDAFCLCKIDCSPTSLKNNAKKYLDADFWEEEVYSIVEMFNVIFGEATKLKKEFPEIIDLLLGGDVSSTRMLIDALPEKKSKKFKKILETIPLLLELLSPEELSHGLTKYPFAWGAIPIANLSEYCAMDSFLTLQLKDHFWEKYGEFYPYYKTQTWLAGTMEAYGYNWDDTTAQELFNYYIEEASNCLYELIQRIDLDDDKKGDAEVFYYNADTPEEKLENLKTVFNPMSNDPKAQKPFWSAYTTPEVQTWAFFLYLEKEILQHEDLDDERFIKALDKTDFQLSVRNLYSIATTKDEQAAVTSILKRAEAKLNLYFQRFAIEITEFQYEAHTKYGGVNIDDRTTWNEPFYMLYYLKRFKKVMKSESTYIRGKIGRHQVYLAEYESLRQPPRRIEAYDNLTAHTLLENQRWILNATFFENGADTKRWRAGIHTVPASSELREIYTPRSDSAVMFHVDYAQNEVRFLAAMAKEENLLAAFDSGVDIHRYVASKIFKKNPENVTDQERRWAKSGTFGLLYGKTVVSFAQDMMGGDLEAAQAFFRDFFAAFPGVEGYIESCHQQVLKHGFVYTMFGDPIYIDQMRYREDEVLRRSQNYPIQSSASSLGAHAISLLNEAVIKRRMNAIPLGFCHDAADWEVELDCLLPFIDMVHKYMVTYIDTNFQVPVGVDWGIGIHQNHLMDLTKKGEGRYHFKCSQTTFEKILTRLRKRFRVEYEIMKSKEEFNSLAELFLTKRAFSKYLGQRIPIYEGILELSL